MTFLSRSIASLTFLAIAVRRRTRSCRSTCSYIAVDCEFLSGAENICLTDAHEILPGWDCGSLTFNDDPAVARYSIELEHALLFRCHYMYRYTLYIHIHYTGCLNNKMKIQN